MEENTAVEKFDLATLMNGVRERIRATFVSLIPDNAWEQMVKKEMTDFMAVKERNYRRDRYSDFSQVVFEVMEERAIKTVNKIMEEYASWNWDEHGRQIVSEKIQEMILTHAGQILLNVVGSMIQGNINELKSRF